MSCHIQILANICDIQAIRRCLFPTDDLRGSDSWLQLCDISLSPVGDVIVIGNERRIVVLSSKWDSKIGKNRFEISFSGSVHNSDSVTSILCLPIVAQSQNSQIGPDWTCIALGFESGHVRFYTENCVLLLEEQLHNERVCSIKCQSQHSPRPDINSELRPEEIYVSFESNICIINGSHLAVTLRNCRHQLARAQANGDLVEPSTSSMNPKKWGFSDQFSVNDVAVVGLDLSNTFDHLLTASICGGFEARYRAVAPHNSLILAVGSKPFIGFHYALEGGAQPVFTDVAKAVANKLKSALPGWLTGGKAPAEKQISTSLLPAEPMGCRFGICDLRRTASTVILSPDKKLAAVSDVLGRIILIDTHKGTAVRIFKGYRDAQCAFVQVPDEKKSRHRSLTKVAIFLIVYSSKKGTLEIFSTQLGLKIATFSASKFSRLLYISYGLMGFTNTAKSKYVCPFTCIFVDSDGTIKEIVIPFHFALTEKHSKRARDLHLFKRLKHFIKTKEYDHEKLKAEVLNTCNELKTIEVKTQCLEMIVASKEISAEIVSECAEYFVDKLAALPELDGETKHLKTISDNLKLLAHFYLFLTDESDSENGNVAEPDTKFSMNEKDLNNLQRLLDLSTVNKKVSPSVTFQNENEFSFAEFLSIFQLMNETKINLKEDIPQGVLHRVSEIIFKPYVALTRGSFQEFRTIIRETKIVVKDLFELALNYWVNRPLTIGLNLEQEMQNLSQLIYTLCGAMDVEEVAIEYNKTSPFWTEIREVLANSARPFPALTAAILCRILAQKIEFERELQQSGTSVEEEYVWEKLSQDNCEWDLLIGKLEDVSLLNIILSNKPPKKDNGLPLLKHDRIDVSLRYILQKGKGSVSELVAQWLTSVGTVPEDIMTNETTEQDFLQQLNVIKKQFPYSLEGSVLLANMCWEYAVAWKKEIQSFEHLEGAIRCLNNITKPHIKQGLFNLMWNTHLKIVFESTCKLVNKVGKLPKQLLCKQDTGLSDTQISTFVEICTRFLDTFMDVLQQSYSTQKEPLRYEGLWENGGQSLADLAQQQNLINYDLLHLHHQLSLTIQMITVFGIKHTKPINTLFDSFMISLFFNDLQQRVSINWHNVDSKITVSRTQFLIKVISSSIETVTVNEGVVYSTKHVSWMGQCLSLAKVWNLDVDLLKRYQVIQLFSNGFDALAEDLITAITEMDKLGSDLLAVAGKRMSNLIASSSDLAEKITALSPSLTKYLSTLNGEWHAAGTLESIYNIAGHSLRCLSEDHADYKLACQLLEACSTLQDLER